MSWSGTYSHTLAIAVDMATASIFWNRADVTVSSLCGLELRKASGNWFLRGLGRALNHLQSGHCESAIAADRARGQATVDLCCPPPPSPSPTSSPPPA